jgi:tetratricopeptide (TPR) repeat protein
MDQEADRAEDELAPDLRVEAYNEREKASDDLENAARDLERAGTFREAADAWEEAGDASPDVPVPLGTELQELRDLEKAARRWKHAADIHDELGNKEKAGELRKKATDGWRSQRRLLRRVDRARPLAIRRGATRAHLRLGGS